MLNRDFIETCSVSANLRSVLFMLFNPVGDELITGGVDGTTVSRLIRDVHTVYYQEIIGPVLISSFLPLLSMGKFKTGGIQNNF